MSIGSLSAGGAERQVVNTLSGLDARGYGPLTLACYHLDAPEHRFYLPKINRERISVIKVREVEEASLAPQVEQLIALLPPILKHDLYHYARLFTSVHPAIAHLWLDEANIKGGIAAVLTGVPRIILSQRNLPPTHFVFHQPYMREAYLWLSRQAGVVMVNNSAAGATAYEEWLGLPRGSIIVKHNGFDFDADEYKYYTGRSGEIRQQLAIANSTPVVGGVFRLSEEKRPLLWLDVASKIREAIPDTRFLIAGTGPMRAESLERAQRRDLHGSVHFLGVQSEALAVMRDFDMLLLTSRVEGLPNVLVEAQAMGVPVVTLAVGGAAETVRHELTGWVLESDDPGAIANIVVELLRNDEWMRSARLQAPAFVKQAFGLERAINETLAVYGLQPVVSSEDRQ